MDRGSELCADWDSTEPITMIDVSKHRTAVNKIRAGLGKFRDSLNGRRVEIAREREKNGREIR